MQTNSKIILYQREECPSCTRVRQRLSARGLSYEVVNVPRLGSERSDLLALDGVSNAEVPVLVDGDQVIQGSDKIIDYLESRQEGIPFGQPSYGLTRTLEGVPYGDAIGLVKDALATEGFGVLTEIDVQATLKQKIDVDVKPYIILGACNPQLAHQAISAEPAIGLLLPCNVVVTEDDDGNAVVSAIDPRRMFKVVDRDDIEPIATDVHNRLSRVMASL